MLIQRIKKNIETPVVLFHKISDLIKNNVIYKKNKTNTNTSAEDEAEIGYGVCQDHTHILISVARELGFPARYVSGYMNLNNSERIEASHAWAEIFLMILDGLVMMFQMGYLLTKIIYFYQEDLITMMLHQLKV